MHLSPRETTMRHAKIEAAPEYRVTGRKLAALLRRQRIERESLPLFRELIAEQQKPPAEVFRDREAAWLQSEAERRQRHADGWRRARARLFAYQGNERAALRHAWNVAPYPATYVYLCDMLHNYAAGRLAFGDNGRLYTKGHLEWLRARKLRQ